MQRMMMRAGGPVALVACLAVSAFAAPEQDADVRTEMQRLRAEMRAMEERHRAEMDALRAELSRRPEADGGGDLTAAIHRLMDRVDGLETDIATRPRGEGAFRLLEVSLNALVAAGGSSEDDETIEALNAGGHDPNRRGFTIQNVELIMKGAVDPYFTAQTSIVFFTDSDGESQYELEEAFAETSSLPWGLQAKVGQFYNAFGRHNAEHPHQWEFVDMPFGWTRMLGPDGMRGAGAQLSWLLPTEIPIQLLGAVQNANGETMSSFIGSGADDDGGHAHGDGSEFTFGEAREREVRSLDDLVWSGRATASFDVSDEWTTLLGSSVAYGPNSAGSGSETWLGGVDLTARWKPHTARRGFPFVDVRFEYVGRDYEYDGFTDDAGDAFRSSSLTDDTWYLQTVWGFTPDWTIAGRYEDFDGDAPEPTVGLEDRTRWSLALTHYFSEFSKVRLQMNRDDSDLIGEATTVWLQLEFNLGAHSEHDDHGGHVEHDDHDH